MSYPNRIQVRALYVGTEASSSPTTLVVGTPNKRIAVLSVDYNINNQSGNWKLMLLGSSQSDTDRDILFLRAFYDIGLLFTLYDCPFVLPVGDDLETSRGLETSGDLWVNIEYALID